jgi:hypothetical protein
LERIESRSAVLKRRVLVCKTGARQEDQKNAYSCSYTPHSATSPAAQAAAAT